MARKVASVTKNGVEEWKLPAKVGQKRTVRMRKKPAPITEANIEAFKKLTRLPEKCSVDRVPSDAAAMATVVCLCGSTKYPLLHAQAMMDETLNGNIVLPMGVYGHADYPPGAKEITADSDHNTPVKQMLDALHFAKILMSNDILVVMSRDGYIGEGTKRDIAFAKEHNKVIRYWKEQ